MSALSYHQMLSLVAILMVISQSCETFEFSGYCLKMCKYGRGGNLCKCSAVHFAGKRENERENDGGFGQPYRYLTDSDAIINDEKQRGLNEELDKSWPDIGQRSRSWPRFFDGKDLSTLEIKRSYSNLGCVTERRLPDEISDKHRSQWDSNQKSGRLQRNVLTTAPLEWPIDLLKVENSILQWELGVGSDSPDQSLRGRWEGD
ncbi:hypothetical protein LSH36_1107g00003 [Paralvinella palmiformis]|uniref:Uncharacterized protein n=1 Tax=Paralvinella palmiformis TaxID=53620 RepID=A0AAD9IUW8_9ANNE|nr:hypothetical protein LSH36_1107g00003 [Paralvinella palmiformis]